MKKYIKLLSYCFIFMILSLCVGIGEVKGAVTKEKRFTCYYEDGKRDNLLELEIGVAFETNKPSHYYGTFKIVKFNGTTYKNILGNPDPKTEDIYGDGGNDGGYRKKMAERVFATNQCPEAITIVKTSTRWWVYSGTKEEAKATYDRESKLDDRTVRTVNISSYDYNQVKYISLMNYIASSELNRGYISGGEWVFPELDKCTYKDINGKASWSIGMTSIQKENLSKYSYFNSKLSDGDLTNGCPSQVYKITYKNDTSYWGYVFFGETESLEWPRLCVDKPDRFKCEKLDANGNYQEYTKPVVPKPWGGNADYYRLGLTGLEYDNQLTLNAKGVDSTVNTLDILVNGKKGGLASPTLSDVSDFANIMLTTPNGPPFFGCYTKEKAKEKGWNLLYGKESDFEYYCTYSTTDDNIFDIEELKGSDIYQRDGDMDKDFSLNTISGINKNFPYWCDLCVNNPEIPQCANYGKTFDLVKDAVFKCRNILGGSNSTAIAQCHELIDVNLNLWAKDGCFLDKIITGNSNNICENLGPGISEWLSRIYTIIKFAVPIIIIAMGIKDFVQSLASNNEDELKKTGSTFLKRLIMGIIFVALPILIEMIITIALGGSFADMCITI